jgi:hypothetical protein
MLGVIQLGLKPNHCLATVLARSILKVVSQQCKQHVFIFKHSYNFPQYFLRFSILFSSVE